MENDGRFTTEVPQDKIPVRNAIPWKLPFKRPFVDKLGCGNVMVSAYVHLSHATHDVLPPQGHSTL
jgi:hypothetical protein